MTMNRMKTNRCAQKANWEWDSEPSERERERERMKKCWRLKNEASDNDKIQGKKVIILREKYSLTLLLLLSFSLPVCVFFCFNSLRLFLLWTILLFHFFIWYIQAAVGALVFFSFFTFWTLRFPFNNSLLIHCFSLCVFTSSLVRHFFSVLTYVAKFSWAHRRGNTKRKW